MPKLIANDDRRPFSVMSVCHINRSGTAFTYMSTQNHFQSSWFWSVTIKVSVLVAIFTLSGILFFIFSERDQSVVDRDTVPTAAVEYELEEWAAELPVRLVIPAINVDAHVQYVGLTETGTGEMGVPDNFTDVGWYKEGVRPGMSGSAVIAGHYNGKETPQAVFFDLDTLEVGDEVIVMNADQIEDVFQVVKIETFAYDAPTNDIFISADGKKRLNLITCSGDWLAEADIYNQRTVVFTELRSAK